MKKLSVQEKAKAYDNSLEKARKWYDANTNEGYRGIFENIFPELKESEDERIRKDIKQHFLHLDDSFPDKAKWLAWLEEQGEKGTKGNNREIPNSDWSEEDGKIFDRICDLIHSAAYENYDVDEDGSECGEYAHIMRWLKSFKDRVQLQWKPCGEQINALKKAKDGIIGDVLNWHSKDREQIDSLYNDLKKLMRE